jgi:hypothetical protein
MLEKADAQPFYFGGDNISFFWRTAQIDDEIFAQRVQHSDSSTEESYRYCSAYDRSSKQHIYDDIVLDFVMYFFDAWRLGRAYAEGAFCDVAGVDDQGLRDILMTFDKTYAGFINDVLYWYSIAFETEPNDDGSYEIRDPGVLDEDSRIAKHVIDRLSERNPMTIVRGDTMYIWQIVPAHGELWFSKHTHRFHDEYVFCTEEYGRINPRDKDAYHALRDSVRSCFMIDGWELVDDAESNPEDLLCLVDLSLETI